jgi:hypothetical protein
MGRHRKNTPLLNPSPLTSRTRCFIVEGETEQDFLKITLGVHPPHLVHFKRSCNSAEGLYKEALKRIQPKGRDGTTRGYGFERVYIVFDTDALNKCTPWLTKIGENYPVHFLLSAPCFEYVLTLCFENKHSPDKATYNDNCLAKHGFTKHKRSPQAR